MSPLPRSPAPVALAGLCLWLISCRLEPPAAEDPPSVSCEEEERFDELALQPTSTLEREMQGDGRHIYGLSLEADTYVHLIVEQVGIDVVATISGPADQILLEVDSPGGGHGHESIQFVAPAAGRYRLEVRSWPEPPNGRYHIRVAGWGRPTSADRDRVLATAAFAKAEGLRKEKDDLEALRAAIDAYHSAGRHWRLAGEISREALALSRVGWMYEKLGETDRAIRWSQRSVESFQETGSENADWASTLNRLGKLHRRNGQRTEALAALGQALELARKLEDGRREAAYLQNIALTYKIFGQPPLALNFYRQALDRWRELGEAHSGDQAKTLSNLAALHIWLGRLDHARVLLEDALALSRGAGDRQAEANTLGRIGVVERRQGDLSRALGSLNKALLLHRQTESRLDEAVILKELGWTRLERGELEAAEAAYKQALVILGELNRSDPQVTSDLGWLRMAQGEPVRALALFDQALSAFRLARSASGEASALHGAARAERQRGDLEAACRRIEHAIEIVESLRMRMDVLPRRSSYLATKQDYYGLLVDLLVERHSVDPDAGHDAAAFEVSERRRARSLLDALAETPTDSELQPQPRPPPSLDLRGVQALLDDDTLLLEVTLGEHRSFLWWVSSTDLELHVLPGQKQLEKLARDAYELLAGSRDRRSLGRLRMVTGRLSQLLLEPVADRLEMRRLLVVSDAALQYVPFAALPLPAGHPSAALGDLPRPMVTEHEVVQAPSLSVLAELRHQAATRQPPAKTLAVVADPVFDADDHRLAVAVDEPTGSADIRPLDRLPATGTEAETILALVPAAKRLALLGFEAEREAVLNDLLGQYRYLHFATHGVFEPERPEVSGLALSRLDAHGRWREKWLLQAHEIARLSLPVEMVVLSACRTGLGQEVRGEGLVGLTQAFLHAGAERVLVSFWPVDDRATAELMERFYRGILRDQQRPAAALRAAQISMLRETRWKAPYYWAGFFLLGEWR